jgi:hypothetical protein
VGDAACDAGAYVFFEFIVEAEGGKFLGFGFIRFFHVPEFANVIAGELR